MTYGPEFLAPRVRLDGPITLVEPDPGWHDAYCHAEERIRTALGSRVLLVEHVGSTSVRGLAAKPFIDIVVGVADSADEAAYVPDLEAAGFQLRIREPFWHEHRFLVGEEQPVVQIHVFSAGDAEIERMVLFRDRLRRSPRDRELYERTKRELAGRRWDYVQDYADAKSAVVERIIEAARSERPEAGAGGCRP